MPCEQLHAKPLGPRRTPLTWRPQSLEQALSEAATAIEQERARAHSAARAAERLAQEAQATAAELAAARAEAGKVASLQVGCVQGSPI